MSLPEDCERSEISILSSRILVDFYQVFVTEMAFPRSICITLFLVATLVATSMAHDHEHHHGRFTESERRQPACGFREPSVKQIEEMRQEEDLLERHDVERSRFLLSGRFRTFLRAFFCRVFPRLKFCDAGTIPVYMFNPHQADFTGFVPLQTIQNMVATANQDFAGTGFQFELKEYTSFVNQEHFDASAFSDAEVEMFRNHRVQDEQIISVFIKRAIIDGSVACGYAGLARTARSAPDIDAITIDYRCADDDLVLSHEIGMYDVCRCVGWQWFVLLPHLAVFSLLCTKDIG